MDRQCTGPNLEGPEDFESPIDSITLITSSSMILAEMSMFSVG